MFLLSVWCGLAAGWLEVATRVFCKKMGVAQPLYLMSRHFLWLGPLSNLLLFSGLGMGLAALTRAWPRFGGLVSPRLVCALALLPVALVAGPFIYVEAWFLLLLGVASRPVPARAASGRAAPNRDREPSGPGGVGLRPGRLRIRCGLAQTASRVGPPLAFGVRPMFFSSCWTRSGPITSASTDMIAPPRPPSSGWPGKGSSFGGTRHRAVDPRLAREPVHGPLAPRARREMDDPARHDGPDAGEYFGSRGYATAGFVANLIYCSYDTGLDRGFTHYEDYVLERLMALRTACLIDKAVRELSALSRLVDADPFRSLRAAIARSFFPREHRKDAGAINREFVGWLSQRPEPARPFFAFLNYLDAHSPYVLPPGAAHRFGLEPESQDDFQVLNDHWDSIDKLRLPPRYRALAARFL